MRSNSRLSGLWTWPLACAAALFLPADGSAGITRGASAARTATLVQLGYPSMSASATFAAAWDVAHESAQLCEAVRLVPVGDAVPDQDGMLAAIREHVERHGVTTATLARALGVKSSVVAMLLADVNKIPPGPRHTLLRDAERWCAGDARERALRQARFIPTPATRLVRGLMRVVAETRVGGLIVGGPGLGKSYGLDAAAAELPGKVVILRADTDSRSAKGVLRAVASAAGLPIGETLAAKVAAQVVREAASVIAVDESQLLTTSALEALRTVFDLSGTGLVLCATSMGRALDTQREPLLAPLVSRFGVRLDLDAELLKRGPDGRARPWIDAATVTAIIERHVTVRIEGAGMVRLVHAANFAAGHLRTAVNGARIASYLAGRRGGGAELAVSEADIAAALQMSGPEGS